MKKLILFILTFGAVAVGRAADEIRIGPAWSFPNFSRTAAVTTPITGRHLHPIFDIGDVNRDGRFDVVVFEMDDSDYAPPGTANSLATVYLQNADGTFTRGADSILPIENVARDFLLADLNEDEKLDLLLNDYSKDLILLLGNGDGTFGAAKKLGLNALAFPALGDLNNDGHWDVVAATREGKAMVFFGAGDGTFAAGPTLATLTNPVGERRGQIMIDDINHDGKLDVAVASVLDFTRTWTGNLDVFLGHGDGTFQDVVRTPNVGTWRGVLGDFNGDGILDYAGDRYSTEAIEIWIGKPDGRFTKRTSYSLSGFWPQSVSGGDLNGDGIYDIVVSNTKSVNGSEAPASLAIFLGKGDGAFQPRRLFDPLDGVGSSAFPPKLVYMKNLPPPIGPFDILQYQSRPLDIVAVATTSDWMINSMVINSNLGSQHDANVGFQLVSTHPAGETLVLESSLDLQIWTALCTNAPSSVGWSYVDSPSSTGKRFYRTRVP